MKRIVVLAPEPIRPRMAGMGIRALELARALGREFDARLLVPNAEEEARHVSGGVPVVSFSACGLAQAAVGADAAVVSGHAANPWFRQLPGIPVAADLYDPFAVENLHYARELGPGPAASDRATLALALARADFFLCASTEQRLFYAGALYDAGRIGPENFPDDPSLSGLLAVVPFGVPGEAAAGDRARGRAVLGLPSEGPLVLFGGIYDWYDPELLLETWPHLERACPGVRLLFFESPNPETTPQGGFARVRQRSPGARSGGTLDRIRTVAALLREGGSLRRGRRVRVDRRSGARIRPGLPHAASRRGVGRAALRLDRRRDARPRPRRSRSGPSGRAGPGGAARGGSLALEGGRGTAGGGPAVRGQPELEASGAASLDLVRSRPQGSRPAGHARARREIPPVSLAALPAPVVGRARIVSFRQ